MKTSILKQSLIIIFFIAPLFSWAQPIQEDGTPTLKNFDLIGNVQDLKLKVYKVEEGQSAKGDLKSYTVLKFNQDGNLSEKTEYASDESIREQVKFVYDDNGNPIERTIFENVRNHATYKTTAEYDEAGNVIKKTNFNPDGSIAQEENLTNDDRGNPIEVIEELLNSESQAKTVFQYDDKGNTVNKKKYGNGDLDWDYNYRYNKEGKLVEITETRGGQEHPSYKTTYAYNPQGLKIEKKEIIYNPDESVGAITKTSYTYDKEGNRKEYKEYSEPKGDRWYKVTREYDKNGNLLTDRQEHSFEDMNYDRASTYDFDSQGNWIIKKEFKAGKLTGISEREIHYFEG